MNYETHTLSNGMRLVHMGVPNLIAHLGVIVNTGSRDEEDREHGMAHFIEHLMFKGTEKRKAYHIISRMEDAGGEINAYTTKEETCIYTSFLKDDYKRALELLYDVVFHSVFPEKEVQREKAVIIDEINSYLDNPSELIFDDFEEQIFKDQPIGRNILGRSETISHFNRREITRFIQKNYFTNEIVVCSVGNIRFSKLIKWVSDYFGQIPGKNRSTRNNTTISYQAEHKTLEKKTYQAHCIIGNQAFHIKDQRRIGLFLLNNILGGPGLNSRLNMSLREKNGFSYHTESHYNPYSDTGVLSVYFSSDKKKLDRSHSTVYREFARLRNQKLGILQLHKAKKQLMGQIAISFENHESLMLAMAKSYLIFNRFDSLEEIRKKIDAITADQLIEIANEILDEKNLSSLTYI